MSRTPFRTLKATVLGGSLGLGLTSIAAAQDAAPPAEPPAVAPAPAEVAETAELSAPVEAQAEAPQVPVAEGHAVQVETEHKWSDDVTIGVFVDAYGAIRSDNNEDRPQLADSAGAPLGIGSPGGYPHEAYVSGDGFGLAFAGSDIAYAGDQFGATVSLRFGPGVNRFYFGDKGPLGIDNITQAYLTWKPVEGLTLDMGQFYTLFGAEVTESWRNLNYSRGGLYYAMQPFWHTGLRANYAINDKIGVNAMVVNGVNSAFEDNKSPTVGLQAVVTPIDELFLAVGYMGALHPRDGGEAASNFDNFFDVVATLTIGDFKVVNNFDFNLYRAPGASDSENWWGVSVAPGYSFTSWFGAAARFEYLSDSANFLFGMVDSSTGMPAEDSSLITLTGTLDFKPIPNMACLVLRPELRYEMASDDYFLDGDGKATDGFWTAMVGAVVTSM